MLITKQLMVAIDSIIYFFLHTMEVNGYRQLFGYQHASKYLLLFSKETVNSYKLEQLESE